jgi:hypothetical protein
MAGATNAAPRRDGAQMPASRAAAYARASAEPVTPLPTGSDEAAKPAESTRGVHVRAIVDGDESALTDDLPLSRAESAREARLNRWRAQWVAKHSKARHRSATSAAAKHPAREVETFVSTGPAKQEEHDAPVRAKKNAKSSESLDDLVEGALTGKHSPAKSEPAVAKADSELPATPSRDQMLAALTKARLLAARCKGAGTATVSIAVKGPLGRASKVSVEGITGSARSCIESAVRKTPFPKFQQENFEVKAPFKLEDT